MKIYRYSMRIYKYSMRFRVPALDQSDCSICYNYDLTAGYTTEICLPLIFVNRWHVLVLYWGGGGVGGRYMGNRKA